MDDIKIDPEDYWLNTNEAAAALGINKNTMVSWRERGIGPTYYRFEPKEDGGKPNIAYLQSDILNYRLKRVVTGDRGQTCHDGGSATRKRHRLTDSQWQRVLQGLGGQWSGGARADTARQLIDLALWLADNGVEWDQIPEEYGTWACIKNRVHQWGDRGTWSRVFAALAGDPDFPFRLSWHVRLHPAGRPASKYAAGIDIGCGPMVSGPKPTSHNSFRPPGIVCSNSKEWFDQNNAEAEKTASALSMEDG